MADVVLVVAGAITGVSTIVSTAIGVLWKSQKDAQGELVDSLRRQALSSETARIASDQARSLAEKRAGELEMKLRYKTQEFQRAVEALNKARVRVDPGALVGSVPPPPKWEDPSAVWHVEADRQIAYFGGRSDREEAERRRQRPLNPEAERRERERRAADERAARRYLADKDDSEPPRR